MNLFPPSASTLAPQVDALYLFLVLTTIIMSALIFATVFYFAIKYRRRSELERPAEIHGSVKLEILWSVIPFCVMLVMFGWGTKLYFDSNTPPDNALDIYVTGKQWMWKVQYPDGKREINELHVPVGQPVKLTLASEDVIHSFYVPAFRVKHDVVPGSYQTLWFQPTQPGRYPLLCAEYCGTEHSRMRGWVTVMEQADYESWLTGIERGGSMAEQGGRLFDNYGCSSCHLSAGQGRCPPLVNVFGRPVMLANGSTVTADEAYLRESILNPSAKIVAGYSDGIMPVFQGQISEEELLQLVIYVKSLSTPAVQGAAP